MPDPAIADFIVLVLVLDTGSIHEYEDEDEDDVRIWVAHSGSQQP